MKEKIYTIPVTEAFAQHCECPLCLLESRLENEYVNYYLGPALMEPDCRIDTNKKGFCRRHYEQLYNRQENRLGLGLVTDTHLKEKLGQLKNIAAAAIDSEMSSVAGNPPPSKFTIKEMLQFKVKSAIVRKPGSSHAARLIKLLSGMEKSCAICGRLEYTMDRYLDVIMYLWSKEDDFRNLFSTKKGFCLVHLKMLIEASEKYLKADDAERFLAVLMRQQIENMERLQQEVEWFTKKFDYRNNDAPWGNSKDALPRTIQKLKGYCNFK